MSSPSSRSNCSPKNRERPPIFLFLAKLTLTPLIMYVTSAAGRRWGPGVSGWLTGLPLLAGPVSVFVCIEQGKTFAAHAAGSTLVGMWSSCAFCLAYHAASDRGWMAASAASIIAFALATALFNTVALQGGERERRGSEARQPHCPRRFAPLSGASRRLFGQIEPFHCPALEVNSAIPVRIAVSPAPGSSCRDTEAAIQVERQKAVARMSPQATPGSGRRPSYWPFAERRCAR